MPNTRDLTEEQKERIKYLYADHSVSEIDAVMGLPERMAALFISVAKFTKDAAKLRSKLLRGYNGTLKEHQLQYIQENFKDGDSLKMLAKQLGTSVVAARAAVKHVHNGLVYEPKDKGFVKAVPLSKNEQRIRFIKMQNSLVKSAFAQHSSLPAMPKELQM